MPNETLLDLRDVLQEKEYKVGTIHTWKDGTRHKKVGPGQWVDVPSDEADAPHDAPPTHTVAGVGTVPQPGKWIDKLDSLPDDTRQTNFVQSGTDDKGKPTYSGPKPDRVKLHKRIESKFLDHVKPVPPGTQPRSILMMGGPASGKSSMVKALGIKTDDFVVADADAVKENLPEYKKAVAHRARNAAAMAHEESSHLVKKIRQQAIDDNKNVVVDGTGANLDSYVKQLKALKDKGYHTHLMMADCDAETALPRAHDRAEKTGRYVPDHFITGAYPHIPKNFMQLKDQVDSFHVFDTKQKPAKLVWSKENGKETIHDPEWHKDFMARAGVKESVANMLRDLIREAEGLPPAGVSSKPPVPAKPVAPPPAANGSPAVPAAPTGKPAHDSSELAAMVLQGINDHEKMMASLPRQFPNNDGIHEIPYELD